LISVNVYEIFNFTDKNCIVLHRRTNVYNSKYHVNLLKIDDNKGKYHYVFIKDYDKLIGTQTNKDHQKYYHCIYCNHGFKKEFNLKHHYEKGCLSVVGQSVETPKKGDEIKF